MTKMSRRSFVGAAGSAAALAGTAALAAPALADEVAAQDAQVAKHPWEVEPEPIDESQILETVEAEVVVVGAGVAGSVAALTAAEAGFKVTVLEKQDDLRTNANGSACWGTRFHKEQGLEDVIDPNAYTTEWMLACDNMPDRRFINMWLERNGADIGWLADKYGDDSEFRMQETGVCMWIPYPKILPLFKQQAEELGATYYFETAGVRLERDADGRATSVIAEGPDGYRRFVGTKGIILSCGDYNQDDDMMAYYLPFAKDFERSQFPGVNDGQMLKAAVWVGAGFDEPPHSCEIHYDPHEVDIYVPWGSGGYWLKVNQNGERFSNEMALYEYIPFQDIRQPGCMHYDIWDKNFAAQAEKMDGWCHITEPTIESCNNLLADWIEEYGTDKEGLTPEPGHDGDVRGLR